MRKIPFDIRYRQEIQSGEFSVVTRDDRPVTILRWDMKGNYPILACTMVKQCNWEGDESWDEERPFAYDQEGHAAGTAPADKLELYILMPDAKVTLLEKEIGSLLEYARNAKPDTDIVGLFAGRLLEATRQQLVSRIDISCLELAYKKNKKGVILKSELPAYRQGIEDTLKALENVGAGNEGTV